MKFVKKFVPVALSLALCATMVAPALAASFTDLQDAIDGNTETGTSLGDGVYGYGQQVEGTRNYEIEAWDGENGREVKLYGEVKHEQGEGAIQIGTGSEWDSNLMQNVTVEHTDKVTIDLNGQDVDMNQGTQFARINKDGTLTLKDDSATGSTEDGTYDSGEIRNGENHSGGDGLVNNYGTFNMDGGTLTDYDGPSGGAWGVVVNRGGTFTMNDGAIEDNKGGYAGGVCNEKDSTFIMNGGKIENNTDFNVKESNVLAEAGSTLGGTNRWLYEDASGVMKEYVPGPDGKVTEQVALKPAQMDDNGNIVIPVGSTVVDKDGNEYGEDDLPFGGVIDKDGNVIANPDPNAVPDPTPDNNGGSINNTTINDVDVPLAGLVTVQEVLEELYKHEGSPDGEDLDGEYDLAIAWAIANELIDEEEVDVEETVTVAILEELLNCFAVYAGVELADGELFIELDGEPDDIVMGEDVEVILDDFFAELEAALAGQAA